jgi:hypothetical protein
MCVNQNRKHQENRELTNVNQYCATKPCYLLISGFWVRVPARPPEFRGPRPSTPRLAPLRPTRPLRDHHARTVRAAAVRLGGRKIERRLSRLTPRAESRRLERVRALSSHARASSASEAGPWRWGVTRIAPVWARVALGFSSQCFAPFQQNESSGAVGGSASRMLMRTRPSALTFYSLRFLPDRASIAQTPQL